MKVKELIEKLKDLPQDHEVIMSKDGEGNRYSPFSDISIGIYQAETTWMGDYYDEEDAEEEGIEGDPVICLWPIS